MLILPGPAFDAFGAQGQSSMDVVKDLFSREPRKARGQEDPLLAAAFVQLAQARTGSAGAALSDLWTVAEAVFAGAATEEKRYLAGKVMSELLEYLYPLALLDWMGGRLEALGLTKPSDRTRAAWALREFDHNPAATFAVSEGAADPLLFTRSRSFGHWSGRRCERTPSERMGKELEAVSRRFERIAERAYLVRNFQVHRAQPNRATALAATLPVFAELVRVALGYVASDDNRAQRPITSAKLALTRIRQVAFNFETAKAFGGGPLRAALADDLNVD